MNRTGTFIITVIAFCLFANNASLQTDVITRAEGYKLIWETLKRPLAETNEPPYEDVQEGDVYYALLTYGKARGILEDGTKFYPNEPLRQFDALVWVLRTRNTDTVFNITYDTIASYAEKYGLPYSADNPEQSTSDVLALIQQLDTYLKNEQHTVSFYSDGFAGRNTAFGEKFNPNDLTAAHRTLPHNTLVRVTNTENGKEVTVRINDRGPYIDGRDLDLSRAAFERIASLSRGVISGITFERLGHKDLVSDAPARCPRVRYRDRLGQTTLNPGIPRMVPKGTSMELSADTSFKMLYTRAPRTRGVRSNEWTKRGESLTLNFEKEGNYLFVLHSDDGQRRRYRTKVVGACK